MDRENGLDISTTQFLLLLHSVPQLGEKGLTRLLRLNARFRRTPAECLSLSEGEWKKEYDLRPPVAAYLVEQRAKLLADSAVLLRAIRNHPLNVVTATGAIYPGRLDRYDDAPPPLLYALGNYGLLDPPTASRFTFTVAVSNEPPEITLEMQDRIAETLIRAGGVPVTGHDRLPYQRLALSAQRKNRPVLYVFDRGLREALGPDFDRPPFAAARIRDLMFDTARDLALSPFRLDDHALGANNRRRDRLVFALSDVVIALDVRSGGTMTRECVLAREQGKLVCVAEGGRDGNEALRSGGCPELPGLSELPAALEEYFQTCR